jgi:hypothetical protein
VNVVLKLLLSSVLTAGLAGWFAIGSGHLDRTGVEQALFHQMNHSHAGTITKSVHCRTTAVKQNFACTLTSTRGTKLNARIHVSGGQWRADWAPVQG